MRVRVEVQLFSLATLCFAFLCRALICSALRACCAFLSWCGGARGFLKVPLKLLSCHASSSMLSSACEFEVVFLGGVLLRFVFSCCVASASHNPPGDCTILYFCATLFLEINTFSCGPSGSLCNVFFSKLVTFYSKVCAM